MDGYAWRRGQQTVNLSHWKHRRFDSGRCGCRTACKDSFQSGNGSTAYFIGKDDEVMKTGK